MLSVYKYILIEKYTLAFVKPQSADIEGIGDVASVLFSNVVCNVAGVKFQYQNEIFRPPFGEISIKTSC